MSDSDRSQEAIKAAATAADLLRELKDDELRVFWDSNVLDQFLGSIFNHDEAANYPSVGEFLFARKLRGQLAANIQQATGPGFSIALKSGDGTIYASPTPFQWFSDSVLFTEGRAPFEGILGRYRPGEVSYAITSRAVASGEEMGSDAFQFVSIEDIRRRTAEQAAKPREEFWAPVTELRALIERHEESEAPYQEWLARNPWVLGLRWERIERHTTLDDENIPDFTAKRVNSDSHDFVEIKPPFMQVFRADGDFTAEFLRAWDQAERYLDFALRNADYLRRKGIPVDGPHCALLVGFGIEGVPKDTLRRKQRLVPAIELMTYEDVLSYAEATLSFVERQMGKGSKTS